MISSVGIAIRRRRATYRPTWVGYPYRRPEVQPARLERDDRRAVTAFGRPGRLVRPDQRVAAEGGTYRRPQRPCALSMDNAKTHASGDRGVVQIPVEPGQARVRSDRLSSRESGARLVDEVPFGGAIARLLGLAQRAPCLQQELVGFRPRAAQRALRLVADPVSLAPRFDRGLRRVGGGYARLL